jgi:hypothetical protein
MRFAIAQPCFGSSEMVLRIKRSSVPCTRSFGFAILWLSTVDIVDCQGILRFPAMAADTANQAAAGLLILIVELILLPGFKLVGMAGMQMDFRAFRRRWFSPVLRILRLVRDCVEWPDSGKALRPTARDERRWPSHQRLSGDCPQRSHRGFVSGLLRGRRSQRFFQQTEQAPR